MSRCSKFELILGLILTACAALGAGFNAGAEARSHKTTHTTAHATAHHASAHHSSHASAHTASTSRHGSHTVVSHHGAHHPVAVTKTVTKVERVVVFRHGRRHVITRTVHVKEHVAEPAPVAHAVKIREKSDVDDSQAQAQAAEAQPRLRNYSLLANAYALYDQGVNERLKGNYGLSTDKLTEAGKLIDQASSIARDGRPSTLQAMVFYELGLSAEADSELGLARDSFVHAVKARPNYAEAYVHLVNVLALGGHLKQAANYLNDGLRECPNDGRLKTLEKKLANYIESSQP